MSGTVAPRRRPWLLAVVVAAAVGGVTGALTYAGLARVGAAGRGGEGPLMEGVLYSVEYAKPGGGTVGFTRANRQGAVPGGNGSWNVDARGKLYPDFLVVTNPGQKDGTTEVIPTHSLVSVRFGDGGIKEVAKTAAAP